MGRTTWRGSTISQKAGDTHSTIAYVNLGWSGLFFDQRDMAGQALWMDLALARQSGQELQNDYVLTTSPAFGNLRKLFRAAVRDTVLTCNDYPGSRVAPVAQPSICDQMRLDIDASPQGSSRTSPVDLSSATPPPPVVDTPVRSLTPNNRSLSFLQSGPVEHPHLYVPQSRGAVSSVSIGNTDVLYYVEPLPLDLSRRPGSKRLVGCSTRGTVGCGSSGYRGCLTESDRYDSVPGHACRPPCGVFWRTQRFSASDVV